MVLGTPNESLVIEKASLKFSAYEGRATLKYLGDPSLKLSINGIRRRKNHEAPRILLLVPPYTRLVEPVDEGSAFADIGLETFEVMKRAGTPIGLLRIATVAKLAGYNVEIIDAPFAGWPQESTLLNLNPGHLVRYGLTDDQIQSRIESFNPDIIGIQCNYTVQWGNARALADFIKSLEKNIILITGGAHSSGDWKNALLDSPFDYVVINEADQTFTLLLNELTRENGNISLVPGIAFRLSSDKLVKTTRKSRYMSIKPLHQTLDERLKLMPLPDFSLLEMGHYNQSYHSSGARVRKDGAWAQIFSTIGCNINCDFCYIPNINGPWRSLGLDWFELHLRDLIKKGVTEVLIEDDHLMHDPLYAIEVGNLLKKYDLPWVEEGGLSLFNLILLHEGEKGLAKLSDTELKNPVYKNIIAAIRGGLTARKFIKTLAQTGCYNIYLAVESANEDSLVYSHKSRLNTIQSSTFEIVQIFAEFGIQVTGGFMLGFVNPPSKSHQISFIESLEQIDQTTAYAKKLMNAGMAYANPFIVTPIPGTKTWEFQQQYVTRDYDRGWSHEKATMSTEKWSAEDIEKARMNLLVGANGKDRVLEMIRRGTWPVDV